ncbi:hypothetical protein [Paraburkholderia pallida]|uniref:Uncharacterized protein n=1 Tax=Paraburkholderia pallida TaxID=2547399 RepID=A0A4P7D238_9BURK|nr:hypothetical protein [Paraburkholderia pallida]QBR00494.1 hypothetical protein E1956_26025 [Paraburkholderia pallida]
MDYGVYSVKSVADSKIKSLIRDHKSFVIEDIDRTNFSEAVSHIEKMIEDEGLRCRVYTKGRAAAVAAAAIPVAPTVIGGWAAGIGIAAHNLVTFNPDYEIAKNMIMGTLTIEYKK